MPPLTTLAGLAAILGLIAGHGAYQSGDRYLDDMDVDMSERLADNPEALALWNSLSASEKRALQNEGGYLESDNGLNNFFGLFGERREVDTDRLIADLVAASANSTAPVLPKMGDYVGDDALASRVAELTAPLDELRARREASYQDEMSEIRNRYNMYQNQLLSSQYQQNAQLMDTMASQLERSRRNALEAGASAGLRLADNINIMLSTQNKQAQTSLETSNQLAQMMLNQRAAARQAQDSYDSYMAQDYANRNAAREQAYDEGYRRYETAVSDYDREFDDWQNAYGDNPVSKYRRNADARQKYTSKYN